MPAIEMKVGIRCQDRRRVECFRHSDERSICEAGGYVAIFRHKFQHRFQVSRKFEGHNDGTAAEEGTERRRTTCT